MLFGIYISLVVLVTVVTGRVQSYEAPVHASGGLPVAGEVWGPVITHAGTMRDTVDGLLHQYGYDIREEVNGKKKDVLIDCILGSDIFQTKEQMYEHIQTITEDDHVVLQSDPEALEGKYLEVLTTKVVPFDKVQITCHSYMTKPAFCHRLGVAANNHKAKVMFSMVKETSTGKTFPCLFFSHQGCTEENNKASCYWVSHINEVVIMDKSLI